ncbi:adenosine receptor A2b isoform X2 [Pelodiscus sinensis]|uniref:adenosine receptor A2b isoform X2 n=1 Tax=Pelodiscus sinensis TaxID=13735 RepID=UPI003F6AC9E3
MQRAQLQFCGNAAPSLPRLASRPQACTFPVRRAGRGVQCKQEQSNRAPCVGGGLKAASLSPASRLFLALGPRSHAAERSFPSAALSAPVPVWVLMGSGLQAGLRYKSLVTGKRARWLIAVLWVLSFGIGLTPLMGWNMASIKCTNSTTGTSQPSCPITCLFENVVTMSYMVYFNFFGCVLLPLAIMLGIYVKIFTVACKQLRKMELMGKSRTTLQREVNAAKSLAIIVGLFAFCWLPLHILNCITYFHQDFATQKPEWVMKTAILLSHANSVINPVIYAYKIQDFRCAFRKILAKYVLCKTDDFPRGPGTPSRHLSVSNITSVPVCI